MTTTAKNYHVFSKKAKAENVPVLNLKLKVWHVAALTNPILLPLNKLKKKKKKK